MKSLRVQLLIWISALLTVVGLLGAFGAVLVSLNEQDSFLDGQLRQIALNVGDAPSAAATSSEALAGVDPDDLIVIGIWDPDGNRIRSSDADIEIPREGSPGFSNQVVDGAVWRTYTLITRQRLVQVSQRANVRTEAAANAALNTILPIAALIPLSWLIVGWVVPRILRPLRHLVEILALRRPESDSRLEEAGLPEEVVPFVGAMNDLLDRQHRLLEFRQRFISDAAHQLRTPLTALLLQMENLKRACLPVDQQGLVIQMEDGLKRASAMLNQLLRLARADSPASVGQFSINELSGICREAISDTLDLANQREIDLGLTKDAVAPVLCDRNDIRMLIGNLLDNAIRYTPAGGQVDICIVTEDGKATIEVTDTGPGIPEEALGHVFDRFYRHASAEIEGNGLGLSIVKALAERNGAEVKLHSRTDRSGLIVRVRFTTTSRM